MIINGMDGSFMGTIIEVARKWGRRCCHLPGSGQMIFLRVFRIFSFVPAEAAPASFLANDVFALFVPFDPMDGERRGRMRKDEEGRGRTGKDEEGRLSSSD